MSAEPAGVESSSTRDATTPDLGGVSAFAAKVLDQLSLSAWLPGTFFAVSAIVLAQFAKRGDIDLARVITDVADQWVTVLVWTFPTLLISVLVIQASSFAAIQFLEGYGGARGPGRWMRSGLIRWQTRSLNRLENRIRSTRRRAFDASVDRWSDQPTEVVMALRAAAYGLDEPDLSDEHRVAYEGLDWRTESDAWRMARLVEMEERVEEFPARHRVLPTRLGNVLRSTEDELTIATGDISQFALRRRMLLPTRVQAQHDQFRARLDMYATMTIVSGLLGALSFALLMLSDLDLWKTAVVASVYVGFAVVSYGASIASARGYCTILRVMDSIEG